MKAKTIGFLQLVINTQFILLPLSNIKSVLRLPQLHEVPNDTPGFAGLLNYHGKSVPVYNLGQWINQEIEITIDTPLLLCESEGSLIGFLTTKVEGVINLEATDLQTPELSSLPNFVLNIYEKGNDAMWLLDIKILSDEKLDLAKGYE